MGSYINPPDMTKEEFLAKNGTPISKQEFLSAIFEDNDKRIVVLVNNGAFTAAAIMFSSRELQYWQEPDTRPAKYFSCPLDLLKPYL